MAYAASLIESCQYTPMRDFIASRGKTAAFKYPTDGDTIIKPITPQRARYNWPVFQL